jgi:hypothetical protein
MAAGPPPAADITPPDQHPAVGPPVPQPGPHRRPVLLLVAAAGLALLVIVAVLVATRQPHPATPDAAPARSETPQAGTAPGDGDLASKPATRQPLLPAVPVFLSPAITATPASPMPTGPAASTGTPPVTIVVTATPASGACPTNFTFVAHFTINNSTRYRWHWVFGGPDNYSSASGDHDQDKTGDVRVAKKFDTKVSGTYWGQVQVTGPATLTSDPAAVQVTCP